MKPEDRLVERLRRELLPAGNPASTSASASVVRLGIGDDAAILSPSGRDTAVTTDVLVESVDFLPG